ncbi:MAG: hypothetical protein H7125_18490 [Proteobacteria bacterium]|nr:hypothetical protein [Burkholderiales bacterium]
MTQPSTSRGVTAPPATPGFIPAGIRGKQNIATVLANGASGAKAGGADATLALIRKAFEARGWSMQLVRLPAQQIARDCALFVREARGLVVAVGGDGTVNAVAAACRLHRRPFGVIPTGTFNYVARALGIPLDPEAAVEALITGESMSIRYGEVNGRVFLNNASIGLYPSLLSQRERDERVLGRHRLVALGSGLRALLRQHPLFEVALELDGERRALTTSTVFFGANATQLADHNIAAAECIRDGHLAVVSLALRSRLDVFRALGAALMGKLEDASAVESFCARQVRVSSRRRRITVALDGELTVLEPPLELRLRDSGLQIMAPAAAANSAAVALVAAAVSAPPDLLAS